MSSISRTATLSSDSPQTFPIKPKASRSAFECKELSERAVSASSQLNQTGQCFHPWLTFPDTDSFYRPCRPVVEMTVGLSEIIRSRSGSQSAIKVKRWAYESHTPLGRGAFSNVFPLREHRTNRLLASKINLPNEYQTAQREYQNYWIWRSIPHIVQVQGSLDRPLQSKKVIILERAPPSLYGTLISQKKMPFQDVLSLCRQLLEMHEAAAARNLVHGDLKPANISYADGKLYVYDLGLAHSVKTVRYNANRLQTLWYRAPELILGKKYTPSIDLWSIGCILYEAFCGEFFLSGEDDTLTGQKAQLLRMGRKIGAPSQSFLEGTGAPLHFFTDPGTQDFTHKIREEAAQRSLSERETNLFVRLLAEILKFENRIDPKAALELCRQIGEAAPSSRPETKSEPRESKK